MQIGPRASKNKHLISVKNDGFQCLPGAQDTDNKRQETEDPL